VTYIEELREVIRNLHGVDSKHVTSVPVKEVFNGQTIWEGIVEVFTLHDHPSANTAYAWTHLTDDPKTPRRSIAVLHIPPAVSPLSAVRLAIAQELRANADNEAEA
jgi:hypothetical protein